MAQSITLQTGAWYGDQPVILKVPETWDITIHNPRSVEPLSDEKILEKLVTPTAQAPLRELCRGKSSPLIIVDDLYRPTPAAKILPYLLSIFQQENIPLSDVTVLMATGAHGPPPADGMRKKIGEKAASSCKTLVHDCFRNVSKVGTTSFGTPVYLNDAVLKSDLVIGIGGVYPNHTAGFGGGSKIVLGVLGVSSISHLHQKHQRSGWGADGINGSFRKDLEEIAVMAKLQMAISIQVNVQREIIQVHCGDPLVYFPEAVRFCKDVFSAPEPHDADVVISNAYPNDLSLALLIIKGLYPLKCCSESATRIVIAACHEGVGLHNIFPYVNIPRFFRIRHITRSFLALPFAQLLQKIVRRLRQALPSSLAFYEGCEECDGCEGEGSAVVHKNPIWLYRPGQPSANLPANLPGLQIKPDWNEVIKVVNREQGQGKRLKVAIYPCAFLQNLI